MTLQPTFQIACRISTSPVPVVMAKCLCSSTDSTRSSVPVKIGVLRRVLVSLRTMGLQQLVFSCLSTLAVRRVRDWFQMVGITTQSVFTEMVEFIPFWNSPFSHFIHNSVNFLVLTFDENVSVFVVAIPTSAGSAKPVPTVGFLRILNLCSNKIGEVINMHLFTLTLEGRLSN